MHLYAGVAPGHPRDCDSEPRIRGASVTTHVKVIKNTDCLPGKYGLTDHKQSRIFICKERLDETMPHRDPETGQFLPHDEQAYDDIEVATFSATVGIPASDLDGNTTFNGGIQEPFEALQLLDYDEIVDRNEELVLLDAHHSLYASINSTETADGSMRVAVEISADPALSDATIFAAGQSSQDVPGSLWEGVAAQDDTIDLIGRPLTGAATGPFSDGSSGAGGGGSASHDEVHLTMAPAEFGRFHPRDELFANGRAEINNVDDAGVHLGISCQHVYGVVE